MSSLSTECYEECLEEAISDVFEISHDFYVLLEEQMNNSGSSRSLNLDTSKVHDSKVSIEDYFSNHVLIQLKLVSNILCHDNVILF